MSEQILWIAATSAVVAFAGLLVLVIQKLRDGSAVSGEGANARVASGYYKPMARLLNPKEFGELAAIGFTPKQVRLLRASRRRAFRAYLADLTSDFRCLHQEARALLRDSQVDRPDLAMELLRQYAGFQFSLLLAHGRLAADGLGLGPVEVNALLDPAQWMQQQVELLRAPLPNAA